MSDVIAQLQSAGLIVDGLEYGKLMRCRVEGDKGCKQSGWYVLHEFRADDGERLTAGRFGNWKTMGDELLRIDITGQKKLSEAELQRLKQQTEELRIQAEAEKQKRAHQAARRAKLIWEKLPTIGVSDYLTNKKIPGYGVRFAKNHTLVVPVRNISGELIGLQFIASDSSKKFLTGTAKQGAFHSIGAIMDNKPLCIAEGYATAASIHMATRWPVAVAFDAGNLVHVAKALREKYPTQKILICADDDTEEPGWGCYDCGKFLLKKLDGYNEFSRCPRCNSAHCKSTNTGLIKSYLAAASASAAHAIPKFNSGVAA